MREYSTRAGLIYEEKMKALVFLLGVLAASNASAGIVTFHAFPTIDWLQPFTIVYNDRNRDGIFQPYELKHFSGTFIGNRVTELLAVPEIRGLTNVMARHDLDPCAGRWCFGVKNWEYHKFWAAADPELWSYASTYNAVPTPGGFVLMCSGLVALVALRRRVSGTRSTRRSRTA